jgi:hypothetical protein
MNIKRQFTVLKYVIGVLALLTISKVEAQKFYLGNYLMPTDSEFEYLGTSTKTGVSTYRYKNEPYDMLFGRKIGDIVVGIRNNYIVSTIYNLIPNAGDYGIPDDLKSTIQKSFPYPFKEVNGVYGLNIDTESISFSRTKNALTFGKDMIMFITTIKQSILENTK